MKHKWVRPLVAVLSGFVAVTAIGGGIAMLIGADPFPPEWLQGTQFPDYTIPALILELFVGGISLVAAATLFTRQHNSAGVALTVGIILAGYITAEVLLLKQVPPGPTWIETLYFGVGIFIALLAGYLLLDERRTATPPGT
jgi:hypothetical protein